MDADIERKARSLLKKYSLSEEQIQKITNILHCICENIIEDYINKCSKKSQTKK